jgi:hypothetical protein
VSEFKNKLLTGVLTQNSNIIELVEFLEKHQRLHIRIKGVTLKTTSCGIMSKDKNLEKSKIPRFNEQNKPLLWHLAL